MGSKEKVHRGSRSSLEQKTALINHMHGNRDFAHGKIHRESITLEWNGLACTLNEMPGSEKTADQWQKSWVDIKRRTKSKYAALKEARRRTGNAAISKVMELDEDDLKVLEVVGPVTLEGIPGSRDSLPQSQAAIIRLMDGDRSGNKDDKPLSYGASSQDNTSSESDGAADVQVADTKHEEYHPTTSASKTKASTSSSGRRSFTLKKENKATNAMTHRLTYEERTSHFAKMQEKQVEAISMMAQAQLLQAQNQAKELELKKDSAEEFRKIRIEFEKMSSYLGQIVNFITDQKKEE